MTGYQSKKKAASAKTIDQVNWADHEPDGLGEPVVRWGFLERYQYEIASLVTQLIFIAAVIILGVLI